MEREGLDGGGVRYRQGKPFGSIMTQRRVVNGIEYSSKHNIKLVTDKGVVCHSETKRVII